MPLVPELDDPKTYVPNRGIVEIHYGVENSTVEWSQDLYDYVREHLDDHERFDPSFCTKDKETGKRYWFACIVCPCTLYRDENLVHHVKGQKHQKRALEKFNSSTERQPKSSRKREYVQSFGYSDSISKSRSTRSHLKERLRTNNYPILGLNYITEFQNPGNPNHDPMYTCSLEGCKSAWGSASEMFNHLISSKNKHNRNYLKKYYDIPNLTVDEVFNKTQQVFEEERDEHGDKIDFNQIQVICSKREYLDIKNRPLDWTEAKARKTEEPKSDLTHYDPPSGEEHMRKTFEFFEALQTQMDLLLEKLRKNVEINETLIDHARHSIMQCDVMIPILERQTVFIDKEKLQQIKDRRSELEKGFQSISASYDIARSTQRIAQGTISTEELNQNQMEFLNNFHEDIGPSEEKKKKLNLFQSDFKDAKDFQMVDKKVPLSQQYADQFKQDVYSFIKKCVSSVDASFPEESILRMSEKVSNAEIDKHIKMEKELKDLILDESMKDNIQRYVSQKIKSNRINRTA